jgi:hypothetical protein
MFELKDDLIEIFHCLYEELYLNSKFLSQFAEFMVHLSICFGTEYANYFDFYVNVCAVRKVKVSQGLVEDFKKEVKSKFADIRN